MEYLYKDGDRNFWKILIEKIPSRRTHKQWEIRLFRLNDCTDMYELSYECLHTGQFNLEPSLLCAIKEISSQLQSLFLEFAVYGKESK
jgi:hypothetical protein